jgi:hypothetical protein
LRMIVELALNVTTAAIIASRPIGRAWRTGPRARLLARPLLAEVLAGLT